MKRTIVVLAVSMSVAMSSMSAASAASDAETVQFPTGQACAVMSLTETLCFDSEAEMELATATAVLGANSTDSTNSAATAFAGYCAGRSDLWLYLYEHSNYGGRVLKFRDADLWQNLTWWDFNDKMSSYRNTTLCTVYIAEHADGLGAWLTVGALTSSTYVGATWNDRASSFYIDA